MDRTMWIARYGSYDMDLMIWIIRYGSDMYQMISVKGTILDSRVSNLERNADHTIWTIGYGSNDVDRVMWIR